MLNQQDIKNILTYDIKYGIVKTTHTLSCRPGGFPTIQVGGKNYRLKDILYVYLYGALPIDAVVIYKDGNRSDHRASNLGIGYTYNQQRLINSKRYKLEQSQKQHNITLSDRKAQRHLNKQSRHKRKLTAMFDKM